MRKREMNFLPNTQLQQVKKEIKGLEERHDLDPKMMIKVNLPSLFK